MEACFLIIDMINTLHGLRIMPDIISGVNESHWHSDVGDQHQIMIELLTYLIGDERDTYIHCQLSEMLLTECNPQIDFELHNISNIMGNIYC
jgi:hypothetical protein